jgi:fatty-acid desaturase
MQAASQEVQDKLSLLRKLKVRFACLVRDLASIPWAKDRKSVELHGREQTFFFFDNNLQTNRNITASQGTSVQGMVLGLLHGIACKEWSGLVFIMVVSVVFSAWNINIIIAAYHIKNE